jgi:predicted ABC-type ATPase
VVDRPPIILALAGTNGAGKSSIGGAILKNDELSYFNPDEEARAIFAESPELGYEHANSVAWQCGREKLERAIADRTSHVFETTLGGKTITELLIRAAEAGLEVCIWYVGLESSELHLERIRERVSRGGHDIPEMKVRERFESSRRNLIRLLPHLTELRVFDNSHPGDPSQGIRPEPKLLLWVAYGQLKTPVNDSATPLWAREIVETAVARFRA